MSQLEIRKSTLPLSAELQGVMEQIRENIAAVVEFRIPRIRASSEGLSFSEDEAPVKTMQGVLIYAKKTQAYYEKNYQPGSNTPPDCYSFDSKVPAPDVQKPMSTTCGTCKMNEWGSNNMKSGKACRMLRPLYFLEVIKEGSKQMLAPIPQMILVTPTSLKLFDLYLTNLTQKLKHFRAVETKIEFKKKNPKDTYGLLHFSAVQTLPEELKQDAAGLFEMWLPVMDTQVVEQPAEETEAAPEVEKAKGGEF